MIHVSLAALLFFLWIEAVHLFTIPSALNTLGSVVLGGLITIFLLNR